MSLQVFTEHEQHVRELDSSNFLGSVTWYSCTSTKVQHSVVKGILDGAGLGDALFGPPADSDVFRRVFQNGHRRSHKTEIADVRENLLVRHVAASKERIVRRVVSELVDAAGETLRFDEAYDIRFNVNHPEHIEIVEIQPNAHAWNLATELAREYGAERGCIDANGVRNVIRRSLAKCKATSLREGSGGIFFVMEHYAEQLKALEEVAQHIPGCNVHSLPLLDDRKQRDMVRKAFQSEAAEELDRVVNEIDELLASGESISDKKFMHYHELQQGLTAKAKEYSELLKDEVGLEDLRIKMLSGRIGKMFAKSMAG